MNIASLVQGISVFFWIATVGILIFVVSSSWRGKPIAKGVVYVISAFLIALILTTLSAGLVFINPEESGGGHHCASIGWYPPAGINSGDCISSCRSLKA